MAHQYISIGIAQAEAGIAHYRWKEFVATTGLKVYGVPGGGKVVERSELDEAIHKARFKLELSEIGNRG